ncbi:iron complex outermembrane receptor protein [Massilia aurea]|uniref:Iron complex outermembrane receptor protein n=1 Tax=Massilia aurea TaxID=373040 RepID=A0A7X0CD35_9BURK|nr:TonB-dependent receptor [Massilia aurea]MBB6133286.1 iron complex outermembrane receptor protein [Massilia aurea]
MYKTIIHTSVAAALLSWGVAAHAADKAVDPAVDSVVDTAAAAAVAPDAPAIASTGVVIVTGTRAAGLTVEDSASPIQVLDASSLARTGQPDLIQALAQNLPSLNAQSFGSDMAAMTLSARLRGLSPNNTLVLVNGKRRHGTANLAVLAGAFQGGAAADLNFIPVAAIERVEVLQDGAAAQYGTDAIAGVINIILKSNYRGGSANVNGGGYMDGGGHTGDGMANIGLTPFTNAYLSLTAETKYHGFSERGGIDPRVVDPATMAAMPSLVNAPGYPYLNKIQGDAQYRQHIFAANFGVDLGGDTELYSFATYGKKEARAFENYRMPNRLPTIYPLGFSPQETFDEEDYAFTFGIKGKVFGNWNWDVSSTYGKDVAKLGVANSANISLFADTRATSLSFKAGEFQASQWTNNLDLRREFDAGMATPLTLALGLEHRRDTYAIVAGDAASRYKEGAQSFPGFSLTDAGKHSRNNKAVYANIAVQPVTGWTVDIAGRFEDFSDFGNAKVGKLTSRYDFTPDVAVRATYSNGFRAPTLAESFYSATNVSPRSAFVQLAPNSPGARLVGIDGLKPEASTNISAGLVLNPVAGMSVTLDAYQITIRDRIVGSGSLYGSGGAINSPAVTAAILANGNVLDPTVVQTGINIFTNAVNTRSRGAEIVATLSSNYGAYGRVDWSAAANYNKVEVIKINQAPTQLGAQTLLDATAISHLETASPKVRLNLGGLWRMGDWTVNLRENYFGKSSEQFSTDGAVYRENRIKASLLTDLEVSYQISKAWSVSLGANNLFNEYPDKVNPLTLAEQRANLDNGAVTIYPGFSPYGINGGYYYARAAVKF